MSYGTFIPYNELACFQYSCILDVFPILLTVALEEDTVIRLASKSAPRAENISETL